MKNWDELEEQVLSPSADADSLLTVSESVLENWVEGRGLVPTMKKQEGFRLIALHSQGARGEPSFNACRETCREVAYHYNLLKSGGPEVGSASKLAMMGFVAHHLLLFVRGKMEVAGLGEFCCSSKAVRSNDALIELAQSRG